jgi:hypothetical protein
MDESLEGGKRFFAAQGNSAVAFDPVEETLDEMAFLVERPINRVTHDPRRVLLDVGRGFEIIGDELAQVVGVVGRIRDDMGDTLKSLDQTAGWGLSPHCPGVMTMRTGNPSASTLAWILVVRPPLERPIP